MSKVFTFFLLACMICLTGCLDYEVRIQVKPDGSGHIIETAMFNKKTIAFLKGMRSKEEKKEKPFSLFDEEERRKKATEYGEGVQYVSGKAIEKDGKQGYTATYAFTDINKLSISQKAVKNSLSGLGNEEDDEEKSDDTSAKSSSERLRFSFTKGSPSTLVISALSEDELQKQQSKAESKKEEEEDDDSSEMALALLKPFMEDMKVRFLVEPQGTITKTNAIFLEGSTITVISLDMNKILENEENTKRLFKESNPQDNTANWNALVKDIPGIQGQAGDIQVQFK